MDNNLEQDIIVDNQSSKKIVRKRVKLFVLGFILLFCIIVGKEVIEEMIFEGFIYIEPKGEGLPIEDFLTDEEYDKALYINDQFKKHHSDNWKYNIKYEEGENDNALYVYTLVRNKTQEGYTNVDKQFNDAYIQKYGNRILFQNPNTDNLAAIVFDAVYMYDMKINKNSCSWFYKGDYLGCTFQGEYIYMFDDNYCITSRISNFKWNFRNKYIKHKSVETNMDYDFKDKVNETN